MSFTCTIQSRESEYEKANKKHRGLMYSVDTIVKLRYTSCLLFNESNCNSGQSADSLRQACDLSVRCIYVGKVANPAQ